MMYNNFKPKPKKQDDVISLKSLFIKRRNFDVTATGYKVSILGFSPVVRSTIVILYNDPTIRKICCIHSDENKIRNELTEYIVKSPHRMICSSDIKLSAGSDIVIVAIDIEKYFRYDLEVVQDGDEILKNIIPTVARLNPDSLYICIGRPNNIVTFITSKLSNAPKSKVFGIGTYPDSIKLQYYLGQHFSVSPSTILVQIIGSRYTKIPLWKYITIGGILLKDMISNESLLLEMVNEITRKTIELEKNANYLNWTVALGVWLVVVAALNNRMSIIPLSCCATGLYDIEKETFLSLPCCISRDGVAYVLQPSIKDTDKERILSQAEWQHDIQAKLGY